MNEKEKEIMDYFKSEWNKEADKFNQWDDISVVESLEFIGKRLGMLDGDDEIDIIN